MTRLAASFTITGNGRGGLKFFRPWTAPQSRYKDPAEKTIRVVRTSHIRFETAANCYRPICCWSFHLQEISDSMHLCARFLIVCTSHCSAVDEITVLLLVTVRVIGRKRRIAMADFFLAANHISISIHLIPRRAAKIDWDAMAGFSLPVLGFFASRRCIRRPHRADRKRSAPRSSGQTGRMSPFSRGCIRDGALAASGAPRDLGIDGWRILDSDFCPV